MSQTVARPVRAEDLAAMGEDAAFELDEGALVPLPPAGFLHGEVVSNVHDVIKRHVRRHRLGTVLAAETGFVLQRGPDTLRAPDVAFVARDRLEQVRRGGGFGEGAPDLAVEVISPDDRAADVERKALQYLAAGVRAVWILFPATRSVSVRRAGGDVLVLHGEDTVLDEPALPGFRCRLKELFDGLEEPD